MNIKDVVIIGAGAAGSSAAFHLANTGNKVALLEKNALGSPKPCGGGMASIVQNWFPFELTPVVDKVINKVEFTWCLSDKVVAELPGSSPFWITRRENLDKYITQKAVEAGAELISSFEVKELEEINGIWEIKSTEGRQLKAKALIIADGSKSKWPKILGLGPKTLHYASTLSIRLEGQGTLPGNTTRFEFGLVKYGFAWAFPINDGVNIGIGTFIGNDPFKTEQEIETLLPSLGFDSKAGMRKRSELRVWNGHSNLHSRSVVIIGDAASLCDPFLAEGLRPALMSGCEAAKYINQWLKGDLKDLSGYSATMKQNWGESMAWGRRISQIFYRFPSIGYQLGIKRPTAPQRIAQILSGEMGYGDIAQRVIKRLLFQRN